MMDYSFIKLNDSLEQAISVGDFKNTQISYYTSVQLSPTESYLQKTNSPTGIVFNLTYSVEVIDECENVLADITPNVFINQYIDAGGLPQCDIEYVNLTVDFYGRAVIIRFTNTSTGTKWYTNPIKITNKEIEKTTRFDYKNYENLEGFAYEVSPLYQSIRINAEYVKPLDESEVGEYYQISTKNTISTRLLEKTAHSYSSQGLDLQTYYALKKVFAHNEIYADFIRVTTNPTLKEDDRKGRTNLIPATFKIYRNDSDVYTYDYQIFEGLNLVSLYASPGGYYTTCSVDPNLEMVFDIPITLGTGTIQIYNTFSSTLVVGYTEADMVVVGNTLTIADVFGTDNDVPANGNYYILVSSGLVSALGIEYEGISSLLEWNFVFSLGMYDGTDYDNNEYLVDCSETSIFTTVFNDTFN
jgi:hypothetical protein